MILPRSLVLLTALAAWLLAPGAKGQADHPSSADAAWVTGGAYRLKAGVYRSAQLSAGPVLLVVLHGDAPFNKPSYQNTFAARAAADHPNVVAVALLRPGYTDPQGNVSDGERGVTNGNNWNAGNTDAIAAAIGELKRRYHARRTVVAGHSGGASLAANILGRHPGLIDAALLVSCPCDVEKWRESMFRLTGEPTFQGRISTLSPLDLIEGIDAKADVILIVGREDKVAPPSLSEAYRAAATRLGKKVRLIQLEGKEHEIFLDPAVFAELAPLLKWTS